MPLTTDKNNPCLKEIREDGQQQCYLVLSEEERAKGFVRPVRQKYQHVGLKLPENLRPLTEEEVEQYEQFGYIAFEKYGDDQSPVTGKYWTEKELKGGCRAVTTMALPLAETYARNPKFYGGTFCSHCGKHLPVAEFVWDGTNERVGT